MRTIMTGIGAEQDQARKGIRCIDRTFSEAVPRETRRLPLASGTDLRAFVQGEACSLNEREEIQPFDPSRRFAGFVIKLIEDLGTKVAVHARGGMLLKVAGLTGETKIGAPVYATGENHFSLESGVVIGQLLDIESFEQSRAIVGFKRADDHRPFVVNGRLFERDRRN